MDTIDMSDFLTLSRADLEAYADYIALRLDQSLQRFERITEDTLRAIEPTFSRALETSREIFDTVAAQTNSRYLIRTYDDNGKLISTDLYIGDWYMANRIADATSAHTTITPDN